MGLVHARRAEAVAVRVLSFAEAGVGVCGCGFDGAAGGDGVMGFGGRALARRLSDCGWGGFVGRVYICGVIDGYRNEFPGNLLRWGWRGECI